MSILITSLLIIASVIALLLILALFMRKEHDVKREIVIDAPRQNVFDYLKLLKNQDEFNEGAQAGNGRTRAYKGTDGTVGFVYAWSGDKDAGVGEKEIMNLVEGKMVEAEIRFVKPMKVTARIILETEAISDTQTNVSWRNTGTLHYPINVLIPLMEKSVAKGMDRSLLTLKGILEK